MGISVEIKENVFLKGIYDSAMAKGRVEGKAEGKAEGQIEILRSQMETRFGALPRWASERLDRADPAQLKRWSRKVLTASSVEGVLGRR